MSAKVSKSCEDFLDPAILRPRLISASIYIAAFEGLKSAIIDRVRGFFWCGFDKDGDRIDPKYQPEVLSRSRGATYASLDWLRENGAVDASDIAAFDCVKTCRNHLSHRLLTLLGSEGLPADFNQCFADMLALLRKIEVWWILNVEVPTNPDFDGLDVDESAIIPGQIWSLQMLFEIALGPEEESHRFIDELRRSVSAGPDPR